MGNKEKKKHKHRSRSRDRANKKEKKKRYSSSDESSGSSRSRSPDAKERRSGKHSKQRSKESDDSDDGQKRTTKVKQREENLEKTKEERRIQKDLIKTLETPEEKRARRLAKKEVKERKRQEKMGWDKDYLGYTNCDNPFGDEHLLDAFVWEKKMNKDGCKDFSRLDMQKMAKSKIGSNRIELEKVKQRRLERENELEERENDREKLQRDKEAEYYREWEQQEDSFHLNQAKLRSQIRIEDGRAKPIDLLAKFISAEDDELAIEMHEPYLYLQGLTIADLEDLLEDIKVYFELEQGKNTDYWRDIVTVTEDELNKLRKLDRNNREYVGERRDGINQAVSSDVSKVFKGKSTNQLLLLEGQIKSKLQGGEGIDIGYWESLLQQLTAHMARTRLRERHQDVLRQKLHKLKQEQGIEAGPLFPVMDSVEAASAPSTSRDNLGAQADEPGTSHASLTLKEESSDAVPEEPTENENQATALEDTLDDDDSEELVSGADQEACDDYVTGEYSPRLFRPNELDIDAVVYETVDDMRKLELARNQVKTTGSVRLDGETEFEKKAREGMNDDEAQFSVEVAIDKQAFLWSDKYRPRKPRFFNRVHTGFEWNKYNQTHYDIDNPPPKIVQGYKFNIFYPDLIDKSDTPQYTVTSADDNKDFGVLKFHTGPPYEDIAFKIVNREWEYSYKRGFRCQFQNNIFQLWFHFKRYRYRR